MKHPQNVRWKALVVPPERAIEKIRPGMSIFLSSGVAEPRFMLRHLMTTPSANLVDLELIQLVSLGDTLSPRALASQNFRLKTFFSGWAAEAAVRDGQVDFIPSRFVRIPHLIESGLVSIDVAIVQVTPPNPAGYCSLGASVDIAREAMERAAVTIGEINPWIPYTFGDTYVQVSEFDFLVCAEEPPIYFDRFAVDDALDRTAANVASLIDDGSCIAFHFGPFFEALGKHLAAKHHLGIHSPFFSDALMDLIKAGAVTNRRKETYRGKALTSYAMGTPRLLEWLDQNPLVEFQRIDKVFSPTIIGRNPHFIIVLPARKVDLFGRICVEPGSGGMIPGPAEVMDFFNGAEFSPGGQAIVALPSRTPDGVPNILLSIEDRPSTFNLYESVRVVVTEYGVAFLEGRTIRERAQALIDIAHPDDRGRLVELAKINKILYPDQIFLEDSARLYPSDIGFIETFKNTTTARFRPIKPTDEEGMRRLFYRFSDESVYYRYFHTIRSMPHAKMQEYVNVDWHDVMSLVGLVGEEGSGRIIAEGRYIRIPGGPYAEVVFVVDEAYQGIGIATFLYRTLVGIARERGIRGFSADVLFSNAAMMKVFKKGGLPLKARLEHGVYQLKIPFS